MTVNELRGYSALALDLGTAPPLQRMAELEQTAREREQKVERLRRVLCPFSILTLAFMEGCCGGCWSWQQYLSSPSKTLGGVACLVCVPFCAEEEIPREHYLTVQERDELDALKEPIEEPPDLQPFENLDRLRHWIQTRQRPPRANPAVVDLDIEKEYVEQRLSQWERTATLRRLAIRCACMAFCPIACGCCIPVKCGCIQDICFQCICIEMGLRPNCDVKWWCAERPSPPRNAWDLACLALHPIDMLGAEENFWDKKQDPMVYLLPSERVAMRRFLYSRERLTELAEFEKLINALDGNRGLITHILDNF